MKISKGEEIRTREVKVVNIVMDLDECQDLLRSLKRIKEASDLYDEEAAHFINSLEDKIYNEEVDRIES